MPAYDIDTLQIEIEASANDAATKINELSSALRKLKKSASGGAGLDSVKNKVDSLNESLKNSSGSLLKFGASFFIFQKIAKAMASWVKSSNEYIENVNLFQVSMGKFYDEAFAYAELVNEKLGIDMSEWMRNQGVFMAMAKGFGLAEDKAYQMSKSLNELTYDISSLYNEDIESAAKRLQSALAGEIEPIRRLGISISKATLQEFALSKGINESVASMTEQEKALLRSVKLIEDSGRIGAIGDFAKTIESPANAIRVLKQQVTQLGRALGNVLLPIITQLLPYAQAFVEVLTEAISRLATFFGFEMPKWNNASWSDASDALGDSLDEAEESAKKLKKQLLGIDELTVLSNNATSTSDSGTSSWVNDLNIPDIWGEGMLNGITTKASELKGEMEAILKLATIIGGVFLGWKIASSVMKFFSAGGGFSSFLGAIKSNQFKAGLSIALLIAGISFSWDAGYNIGRGTADLLDNIMAVLGPIATGIGGAIIGSYIYPGIGTVIGLVVGLVAGVVVEAIAIEKGRKQALIDKFNNSDEGKWLAGLKAEIEETLETDANIKINLSSLTGEIDADTLAKLSTAKTLVEQIFTLNDKDNLTSYEAAILKEKVDLLNGLGLPGLTLEFDTLTGKVQGTRAEVEGLLKDITKQYKLEALREQLIEAYKEQFNAEAAHKKALKEQADATELINDITKRIAAEERKLYAAQYRMSQIEETLGYSAEALRSVSDEDLIKFLGEAGKEYAELRNYVSEYYDIQYVLNYELGVAKEQFEDATKAVDGTGGSMLKAAEKVSELEKALEEVTKDALTAGTEVGTNLAEGIARGLANNVSQVKKNARTLVQVAFDEMTNVAQIHSPSVLFEEKVGRMIGLGVAGGIEKTAQDVKSSVSDMVVGASSSFKADGSFGESDSNSEVVSAMFSVASMIVAAIESNSTEVVLDGKKISRSTTENQSRRNRMYGKSLVTV